MANKLIKCPVCGNTVSSGAPVCPNCGEKIKAGKARCKWLGFAGLFLAIVGIACLVAFDAMDIDLDIDNQMAYPLGAALIGVFCMIIGFSSPSV